MDCCNKDYDFTKYSLVKAAKSVIKHFTTSNYNAFVSEEIKEYRLKMCKECDQISETLGKISCKQCGCFLEAKAKLVDQSCPHPKGNKWENNN
jgi:hypothetical protein